MYKTFNELMGIAPPLTKRAGGYADSVAALEKSTDEIFADKSLSEADRADMLKTNAADFTADARGFGVNSSQAASVIEKIVRHRRLKYAEADPKLDQTTDPPVEGDNASRRFRHLGKEAPMNTPTAKSVAVMLEDYAKAQAKPGEKPAAAYLRLIKTDRFAKSMFDTHQALQRNATDAHTITKRAAPESGGLAAIEAVAATIQKREPKLTKAQAFTREPIIGLQSRAKEG